MTAAPQRGLKFHSDRCGRDLAVPRPPDLATSRTTIPAVSPARRVSAAQLEGIRCRRTVRRGAWRAQILSRASDHRAPNSHADQGTALVSLLQTEAALRAGRAAPRSSARVAAIRYPPEYSIEQYSIERTEYSHVTSSQWTRSPVASHGDARLDLTDVFAFAAPAGDRCVLIMNVNPDFGGQADAFHPDAVYRINIDTDGDSRADIALQLRFLGSCQGSANGHGLPRDRRAGPRA